MQADQWKAQEEAPTEPHEQNLAEGKEQRRAAGGRKRSRVAAGASQ